MLSRFLSAVLVATLAIAVDCQGDNSSNVTLSSRNERAISLFNIVRFQNGVCASNSGRMGTCYTAAECSTRSGAASGTCAGGYGVCCVFSLGCGGMSAESCTYLTKPTTPPVPTSCTYTICRCAPNICRVRLDFQTFVLAPPEMNAVVAVNPPILTAPLGPQLGDCVNENFVVTAPANVAPPVICGFNTGQHMFLDASALCHTLTFNTLSGSTSNWEIKVTQFVCGAEAGGPDGCLQYYTGTVGTFASFNFPTNVANVPLTTTHLSNQCYSMCFKQEPGQCAICFAPVVMGIPGTVQGSFGLSNPNSVVVTGSTNQNCISDFLRIPGGEQKGPFAIGDFSQPQISKVCGRIFSAIGALTANTVSVCTQLTPFRLDFKTDANEVVDPAAATAQASELVGIPGGIIGFNLKWAQIPC